METLQRTANRGSISTGPYEIDNSLKFDSGNSEYLYITKDTSGSDWNRLKWTASMWVKHIPTESSTTSPKERMFGASDTQSDFDIRFRGQPIGFRNNSDVDGVAELRTSAVYRDYSAWYHVVAVWDTANATAGNRMRLYVNGEEVTDFSTDTQPSQNEKSIWGKKNDGDGNVVHTIGAQYNASTGFTQGFNGYMAEIHWVEGEALAPTDFGEFDEDSAIWIPKQYTGSYGTNGFYLDFSNSGSLGADASGNGNNWSLNNIAAIDQATDTPTNNFCTFNAIQNYTPSTVLSDGGTLWDNPAGQNWQSITGTFAVASGKWYWEVRGATYAFLGIADVDDTIIPRNINGYYLGNGDNNSATTKSIGMYSINGQVYNAPNGSPDGTSYTSANMIGFALDMDNRKMWISKDGTWISSIGDPTGTPSGGIALTYLGDYIYPAVSVSASNGVICAFGGIVSPHVSHHNMTNTDANGYGAFKSSPPSGYYALCTKNLAEYG
jgi:hypothetical protein